MSELGDSYQRLFEEDRERRTKNQKDNTEIVMHLSGEYRFNVQVLSAYHLRLDHPGGKPLDYYPQRGRATWLGTNRWITIGDIESFILDNWVKEDETCSHCSGTSEGATPDLPCPYCQYGIVPKVKDIEP